ncbi:MAG: hypothetical protein LBR13_01590, partial [Dysgonamonadaceae bacterium]|nr:hypothetical protein [Dysgonamonadaceae bacterium]
MKRFIYFLIDLLVIYGSIFCVFYFLGLHGFLRDYNRNFDAFKYVMPILALIYFIFQYVYDVNNTIRKNLGEVIYSVFLVSISLIISTMGICFLFREVSLAFPRSVILISGFVYFIVLSSLKTLIWQMDRKIHGIKTLTVISSDNEKLSDEIESKYSGIYKIENRLNDKDEVLPEHIKSVDEVFISANVIGHTRRRVLKLCIDFNKDIFFVPSIFDLSIMSSALYKTGDIPTFLISNVVLSGDQRVL